MGADQRIAMVVTAGRSVDEGTSSQKTLVSVGEAVPGIDWPSYWVCSYYGSCTAATRHRTSLPGDVKGILAVLQALRPLDVVT